VRTSTSAQPTTAGHTGASQVPDDFAEFVADHEVGLRTACAGIAGNDVLANLLAYDLLAAVALRWRWFATRTPDRRRRAAAAYLHRLLRREARSWGSSPPAAAGPLSAGDATPAVGLADRVWHRAATIRARRRLVAVTVVACLGLVWTVGPRTLRDELTDPFVGPTAVPEGVTILPPFGDLAGLDQFVTPLPTQIHVDLIRTPLLRDQPVPRAAAILRPDLGPLVVLAEDGTTRIVNDTALLGAQTLTTSLSPDGTRVALPASEGLVVLDVASGTLRSLPVPAARLGMPALVWRTETTVIVPGVDGALEVNVDTGTVAQLAGLTGFDIASPYTATSGTGQLTEILPATTDADRARLRLWGTPPESVSVLLPDRGRPLSTQPPAATGDFVDRAIGGPPWLNDWFGAGWTSGTLAARACTSRSIPLPATLGRARSVVAAIGLTGAYIGTLIAVDRTTLLEVLGFVDPRRILVAAHAPQEATVILAWYPQTAQLRRVATVDTQARTSLPDMLRHT
jgi:hypothetical protein